MPTSAELSELAKCNAQRITRYHGVFAPNSAHCALVTRASPLVPPRAEVHHALVDRTEIRNTEIRNTEIRNTEIRNAKIRRTEIR